MNIKKLTKKLVNNKLQKEVKRMFFETPKAEIMMFAEKANVILTASNNPVGPVENDTEPDEI